MELRRKTGVFFFSAAYAAVQPGRSLFQNSVTDPNLNLITPLYFLLRKEVIHPHVPVGIPCYDLTPVIGPALDDSLP